jgi:hypothetical protein
VRLTFQGMMKKRVIRPAVIFIVAVFGSYTLGYYGYGAIYAVLLLMAIMSMESVLFRCVDYCKSRIATQVLKGSVFLVCCSI